MSKRGIHLLAAKTCAKLVKDGVKARHKDGGSLFLEVKAPGQAAWVYRWGANNNPYHIGTWEDFSLPTVTEIAEGHQIADAQLKAIVSGELTTAEHKMKPPFDFHPVSTCWFGTNHMPHTRDFSDALFRGTRILEFNNKFSGVDADPMLIDKLKGELPGILNLALKGAADTMNRGGIIECASHEAAAKKWRMEADQVAQFVDEMTQPAPEPAVASKTLYDACRVWAESVGIRHTVSQRTFTQRLERLGSAKKHKGTGGARMLAGIRLDTSMGK